MGAIDNIVQDLADAIKSAGAKKTSAYDTTAVVKRIEDGTAWVHIPGGVDETPVKMTIAASVGDTVQVRVSGGRAFLVGNGTAPPTDDTTAIAARTVANKAQATAQQAQEVAEGVAGTAAQALRTADDAETLAQAAQEIANATNQHFWVHPTSGAIYITTQEQDDYLTAPSGRALLITTEGMLMQEQTTEGGTTTTTLLATFTDDGTALYQDGKLAASMTQNGVVLYGADGVTAVAQFAANGVQLGQNANGKTRVQITGTGFTVIRNNNGADVELAAISARSYRPYATFSGNRKSGTTNGWFSFAAGENIEASGDWSHGEGCSTKATNAGAHAEGYYTEATGQYGSHAEGYNCEANGEASHAEGSYSIATAVAAHAEGSSVAQANYAHAEGNSADASGQGAHAEGLTTTANGDYSHAQGISTSAYKKAQTTLGTHNVWDEAVTTTHPSGNTDYGQYAFIIGNGTADNNRSNALTVDWSGNLMTQGMAGAIQMFAGSTAPTGWLMCDGSAVSRTDYATLFNVIGTTYGAGDGSTTFNLPDMRGRVAVGVGDGTATEHTTHTLGEQGGRENAIVPYHNHAPNTSGEYFVTSNRTKANAAFTVSTSGSYRWTIGYDANSVLQTRSNTSYAGSSGNATGANMQPYLGLNYIIATGKTS